MARIRPSTISTSVRATLVVAAAAVLAFASVMDPSGVPGTTGPLGRFGLDTWFHAGGYAALALLLFFTLADRPLARLLVAGVAIAAGYGLCLEFVQLSLPYRAFSTADVATNAIGASLAAVGWWAAWSLDGSGFD